MIEDELARNNRKSGQPKLEILAQFFRNFGVCFLIAGFTDSFAVVETTLASRPLTTMSPKFTVQKSILNYNIFKHLTLIIK